MTIGKKSVFIRLVTLLLVCSLITPCCASAATLETAQPYASDYFTAYNTYICAMGSGRIEIWFTVTGTHYMDEIGSLKIMLYESTDNQNWTWKKTFLHEDYETMLASNKVLYTSCVSYQGVIGRYYKAYVCLWAGKDGGGETRYMWATSVKAT